METNVEFRYAVSLSAVTQSQNSKMWRSLAWRFRPQRGTHVQPSRTLFPSLPRRQYTFQKRDPLLHQVDCHSTKMLSEAEERIVMDNGLWAEHQIYCTLCGVPFWSYAHLFRRDSGGRHHDPLWVSYYLARKSPKLDFVGELSC